MPRIVRCGLIQAQNVLGPEAGLPKIKKAMIDKHVALIAEAARKKVQDPLPAGALLRPLLLRRAGDALVRHHRARARRPDRQAHAEAREEARDGHRRPHLRGGAAGRLLQHRRRDRRRRQVPRQVPQDAHPALQAGLLGEVLLPPRQPRLPGLRDRLRARSASTSATTATSPRARARSGLARRRDRLQPLGHRRRACREYLWKLEQPAHAVANGYFVGAINRVGNEAPWNIGEFYGQSYFCDPRGQDHRGGAARQGRGGRRRPRTST